MDYLGPKDSRISVPSAHRLATRGAYHDIRMRQTPAVRSAGTWPATIVVGMGADLARGRPWIAGSVAEFVPISRS